MATGQFLCAAEAGAAQFPASNAPFFVTRNTHEVLNFDATTSWTCYFRMRMPENYAGGGITVMLAWMAATATTGTIGWLVALERLGDGGTDLDADSFASDATVTAETVDGTSGIMDYSSVNISNGANMDSVVAGDWFRLKVARDVSNDDATGYAQLVGVAIKEQ